MGSAAGHHSVHSHTTKGSEESSSESKLSHNEEDTTGKDESAKADKGGVDFQQQSGGIRWQRGTGMPSISRHPHWHQPSLWYTQGHRPRV